jgi:hypothetical protein
MNEYFGGWAEKKINEDSPSYPAKREERVFSGTGS